MNNLASGEKQCRPARNRCGECWLRSNVTGEVWVHVLGCVVRSSPCTTHLPATSLPELRNWGATVITDDCCIPPVRAPDEDTIGTEVTLAALEGKDEHFLSGFTRAIYGSYQGPLNHFTRSVPRKRGI